MDRRDFVKICGLLGLSLPSHMLLSSMAQSSSISPDTSFSGTVLIVGAGAAGMTAGYLLAQQNIDFQILEASKNYGGRMKHIVDFADFPIPLGAEWLHAPRTVLTKIVNDSDISITTKTKGYDSQDPVGYFDGDVLEIGLMGGYSDKKFIDATWNDFYEEYILPSIKKNITYNTQVTSVDYKGDKVTLTDSEGQIYRADKLIFTAPLKILQRGDISFSPELHDAKARAIEKAVVWDGIKIFLEFSHKFYPVFVEFEDSETAHGQRVYYDAAYGQNSQSNILGLFAVGKQANRYQRLSADAQLRLILGELDEIFDGQASKSYVKHVVQNWNEEPFIHGAYLADNAPSSISRALSDSLDNKIYFAGEAYTKEDDWGAVDNAARSARDAVYELLS